MTDVHGYCTLCRSRCGAIYSVDQGGVLRGVRPDPDHPTGAAMCPKGRAAPELVYAPGRLTHPLRRTTPKGDPDPGWQRISWDAAMAEVAERLGGIKEAHGAEAVAFAVTTPSGSPMADSIEWVERFIRIFGSPNTLYSTEICNWHKDFAHRFTFGTGLPSPDHGATDLTLLWGHNPAKTWLARSAAIAESQARGARLAVIDPRRSTSALGADHWIALRPGTDGALALGLANRLLDSGTFDYQFVRRWSNAPLLVRDDTGQFLTADDVWPGHRGFVVWDGHRNAAVPYDTEFEAVGAGRFALSGHRRVSTPAGPLSCTPAFEIYRQACAAWPLERAAEVCGVPAADIAALADDMAAASSVSYAAWSGIAQHTDATQTERAIATLYALTGSFDAPGGNRLFAPPVTQPVTSPDQLAVSQRARALGIDEFPLGPPAQGWINARDFCSSVLDSDPYRVRALVSFGTNMLLSQPDPQRTASALREVEFSVHLDMFENPTARYADLLLPVNSPYEHEALRAGFEISVAAAQRIQLRPRLVDPVGDSRSDTEVVFDLACRLGMDQEFFGGDIDTARNHQLAPLGLTVAQLRDRPRGADVTLADRPRAYATRKHDHSVVGFATPTRRVEFYSAQMAAHGYDPVPVVAPPVADPAYPLLLTCAKNGYFCHSQHRGLSSLRRRSAEPFVDLHPDLAAARRISEGQHVRILTPAGSVRMKARLDSSMRSDVVVAEYGWWEGEPNVGLPGYPHLSADGPNYNLLITDGRRDPISGSIPLRSSTCEVQPDTETEWTAASTRDLVVTDIRKVATDTVALDLEPSDGQPLPNFLPGQHLSVRHDGDAGVTRRYSLTGPAFDARRRGYQIMVRKVPGGRFSTAVHEQFRRDTVLQVGPPAGVFTIPVDAEHPVVLIAVGVGVTPFLSYLETLYNLGGATPEVHLFYGNRDLAGHAGRQRLAYLQCALADLRVVTYYSQPEGEPPAGVRSGRFAVGDIDQDLIDRDARFYLCGPEVMLDQVTVELIDRGAHRFAVFAEKFYATNTFIDHSAIGPSAVSFARSATDTRWQPSDGSLLQLAERAGLTPASGCRVGQCESCVTTVLQGTVAHLVSVPDGLSADQCLPCQAIPTSDVVLDL